MTSDSLFGQLFDNWNNLLISEIINENFARISIKYNIQTQHNSVHYDISSGTFDRIYHHLHQWFSNFFVSRHKKLLRFGGVTVPSKIYVTTAHFRSLITSLRGQKGKKLDNTIVESKIFGTFSISSRHSFVPRHIV
jgi:hypothetical protein